MASSGTGFVHKFLQKVRWGVFWGGVSDSVSVLALFAGSLLLVLRFLGVFDVPLVWLCTLVPFVIVWCAWRLRQVRFSPQAGASYIDRTLNLDGLLISAQETDLSAWNETLQKKMQNPRSALPRFNLKRLLSRPVLPLLFCGGILMLPEEAVTPPVPNPLVKRELDRLTEEIETLREEKLITAEKGEELEDKLKKLRKQLSDGSPVEWSDVDAVKEGLAFEKTVQAEKLEKTEAALSDFSKGCENGTSSEQSFQNALRDAADAGLLDAVSSDLAKALSDALRPDGTFDPAKLAETGLPESMLNDLSSLLSKKLKDLGKPGEFDPATGQINEELLKRLMRHALSLSKLSSLQLTPEEMAKLARLLQEASQCQLGKLCQGGALDPSQLARLKMLLDGEMQPGGMGNDELKKLLLAAGAMGNMRTNPSGIPSSLPGRGGITRGRGDAPMVYGKETPEHTGSFKAEKLPPGAVIPTEWEVTGLSRAAPDVAPQRDANAGGAGEEGIGKTTGGYHIAPRHRKIIRKFYSAKGTSN